MYAIRYLVVNREIENFEAYHDDNQKERLLNFLVDFIDTLFASITQNISKSENQDLSVKEQSDILKKIFILKYLLDSFFDYFSINSHYFNLILIEKTRYLTVAYQMLHNLSTHKILKNYQILSDFYVKVLDITIDIVKHLCYFFNNFKNNFELFNAQCFYNLIESLKESLNVNKSNILLEIIPFVLYYEDDDEKETRDLLNI